MDTFLRSIIWQQFGATIDMLEQSLQACPDNLWRVNLWPVRSQPPELAEFWCIAYHTLFWLDLYLSGAVEGFTPPASFSLDELDPAGVPPDRLYSRDELQAYLEHDRAKCRLVIESLTDENARRLCKFPWGEVSFAELLLDNMRHVQEHVAQLNMILGQKISFNPGWKTRPKSSGAI
jgi:hypothetical protein